MMIKLLKSVRTIVIFACLHNKTNRTQQRDNLGHIFVLPSKRKSRRVRKAAPCTKKLQKNTKPRCDIGLTTRLAETCGLVSNGGIDTKN